MFLPGIAYLGKRKMEKEGEVTSTEVAKKAGQWGATMIIIEAGFYLGRPPLQYAFMAFGYTALAASAAASGIFTVINTVAIPIVSQGFEELFAKGGAKIEDRTKG